MPRPRQGWGSRWRACCGRSFAREGTLRKSVRRDGAKTASARGEANEAVRRMIQYGENRVRAGRRLSNRLPRARRAPPRRREIVKKSLRLAARACHLLSICYDGSAAAAGPPPRMAARGARRGMSAREREAIPPEVKRRVMAGDARGSGAHRRTADAPRPERDARGSGSPRRRAGRTGRVRGNARASCGSRGAAWPQEGDHKK